MFCENCGKQIDNNAKFCEHCGAVINTQTIVNEKSEQAVVTSTSKSIKRKTYIFIACIIILPLILIIEGCTLFDVLNKEGFKKGEEEIKKVQDAYFEFLLEMTVSDLLYEYYGEDYWNYNVDNIVDFHGTNQKDKSGLAIDFSSVEPDNTVEVTYIKYHKENETAHDISQEAFEKYILSLYAQLDDSYQIDNGTEITETTEKVKTTPIATTKATTTKAKSDDKTYSITFEADELIEEASLQLGSHVGVAVLSNLTCSNGNANIETKTIYTYDSLVRVEVTGAKTGEVVLGGTITTYGLDTFEGKTVSYPVDSGVFLISKADEKSPST